MSPPAPRRIRPWRLSAAFTLALFTPGVLASYGQMHIDLSPLLAIVGVFAGAQLVMMEFVCRSARRWPGWPAVLAAALLLTLFAAATLAFDMGGPLRLPLLLLGALAAALCMAQILVWLPLAADLRASGMALAAIFLLMKWRTAEVSDLHWFLPPLLAVWAVGTYFQRDRPAGATSEAPLPRSVGAGASGQRRARALDRASRWLIAVGRRIAEIGRCLAGRSLSLPMQGVLLAVLLHVLGWAIVALQLPVLSALMLSLASTAALGVEAPLPTEGGAAAYWLSFGLIPSALTALVLTVLRRWRTQNHAG